jgi:alkanesulfonate monooxygenase SsuD/methylene tetrahydromethanopterin reductase-like flavin-dependent oxidoreductase (luciferase family)
MAQHAEAAGFDSLWVADHFMIPGSAPGRARAWPVGVLVDPVLAGGCYLPR